MTLKDVAQECVRLRATDIHVKIGKPPIFRINNSLIFSQLEPVTPEHMESFLKEVAKESQLRKLEEERELDFGFTFGDLGRFRINVYFQRGNSSMAMRRIRTKIPKFQELSLPPVLEQISKLESGLVLVAGPTSSGKSTTVASIVDFINQNEQVNIVTVEDPIEYVFTDQKSIVNQREVGSDTLSFHNALKHVLREDPDIIVIGEMRDTVTFESALSASETGHLVLSTVHALDTISIITRILDFFPSNLHEQVRKQLAYHIKATVCQKLLPRKDGKGLIPAVEVMLATPTIVNLIIENRVLKIPAGMRAEKDRGMQTFNDAILQLLKDDRITESIGFAASPNPDALRMNIQGIFLDEDTRIIGM
ncbi:MAG TPA: PilT/PilU family type 4a pilus ATPase [bacterium]|nr:PilT/PilU family type 4a pilus ATPase [bacterium]